MMPSFYPNALPGRMPPTPPDYYDYPSNGSSDFRQLPALHLPGSHTQGAGYGLGRSEAHGIMPQHLRYNPPSVSQASFPQETRRHGLPSFGSSIQGTSGAYNAAPIVPLLPPIRVPEHKLDDYQQNRRSRPAPTLTQEAKEEKPIGGVAAHLDYEMDVMVDFVSETAQGMYDNYGSKIYLADIVISRSHVEKKTSARPEFRKFVSQVLSSTRLPGPTILLGLHYLATRMTMLSTEGKFQYGNGSVHWMLTIALLLGSKFLDDNTFQNRSWSEVSSIPVGDLNRLEVEWLAAIGWNMHVDPDDPKGFLLWHQQWQQYEADKHAPLVQSMKRIHIDEGSMQRNGSFHQLVSPVVSCDVQSYAEHQVAGGYQDPRYDLWPALQNSMEYSPPSAPETGPHTPEWCDSQYGFGFGHASHHSYPASKIPAPLQIAGINASHLGYHTPFAHQYNGYSHGSSCGCGHCSSYHDRYLMAPGYGPQSVVG